MLFAFGCLFPYGATSAVVWLASVSIPWPPTHSFQKRNICIFLIINDQLKNLNGKKI